MRFLTRYGWLILVLIVGAVVILTWVNRSSRKTPFVIGAPLTGARTPVSLNVSLFGATMVDPYGRLWHWGHLSQSEVPLLISSETNWVKGFGGFRNIIALKRDGTVWEARSLIGSKGKPRVEFVQRTNLQDVVDLACGTSNLALRRDGTVWGWGANSQGELGLPRYVIEVPTRLSVPGPVKKITAGLGSTAVLLSNGAIWGVPLTNANMNGGLISARIFLRMDTNGGFADLITHTFNHVGVRHDGTLWVAGMNMAMLGFKTPLSDELQPLGWGGGWHSVSAGQQTILAKSSAGTWWQQGGPSFASIVKSPQSTTNIGTARWKELSIPTNLLAVQQLDSTLLFMTQDGKLWSVGARVGPIRQETKTKKAFRNLVNLLKSTSQSQSPIQTKFDEEPYLVWRPDQEP